MRRLIVLFLAVVAGLSLSRGAFASESSAQVMLHAQVRLHFCVDNQNPKISAAQVDEMIVAVQTQLDRDVAPAWHRSADIADFCVGDPNTIAVHLLPGPADDPFLIGQHGVVDGRPDATVYASPLAPLSTTFSHEVIETLIDPMVSYAVHTDDETLIVVEVCDAVQEQYYAINDVLVSDFDLPAWFVPGARAPYDFLHVVTAPFQDIDGSTFRFYPGALDPVQIVQIDPKQGIVQ